MFNEAKCLITFKQSEGLGDIYVYMIICSLFNEILNVECKSERLNAYKLKLRYTQYYNFFNNNICIYLSVTPSPSMN